MALAKAARQSVLPSFLAPKSLMNNVFAAIFAPEIFARILSRKAFFRFATGVVFVHSLSFCKGLACTLTQRNEAIHTNAAIIVFIFMCIMLVCSLFRNSVIGCISYTFQIKGAKKVVFGGQLLHTIFDKNLLLSPFRQATFPAPHNTCRSARRKACGGHPRKAPTWHRGCRHTWF